MPKKFSFEIAFVNIPENSTAVTTVTAIDPDGSTRLHYSIDGGPDEAPVKHEASGVLAYG